MGDGAAFAVSHGSNGTSLLLSLTIGYATKYVDISVHYEHYSDFKKLTTTEVLVRSRTSWSSFSTVSNYKN
jgi:hypothetical protein